MTQIKLKEEYANKEELLRDLEIVNAGKPFEERTFYCSYLHSVKKKRFYVPCTFEYYKAWRNMLAAEYRKRERESRCLLPAKNGGYKRCMESCQNCPYGKEHRDRVVINLDVAMVDDSLSDYFATQSDNFTARLEYEEMLATVKEAFRKADPQTREILRLYYKKETMQQIADELGLHRLKVLRIIHAFLDDLKEKLKNF